MVNPVMDAIALLSSLATDLDVMLNDLRSSPTSRFTPPSVRSNNQSISILPTTSSSHFNQDFYNNEYQQQQQQNNHNRHIKIHPLRPLLQHRISPIKRTYESSEISSITSLTTTLSSSYPLNRNNLTTTTTTTSRSRKIAQQQTNILGHTNSTSERNSKWSSETTSSTAAQQLLKTRRLPFCGIDSSVNNINGNSNGSGGGCTININSNSNHVNGIQDDDDDVDLDAIDANDGCAGDDDLQALLPNCRQLSRDELSQSRASLISSSDGGILAEGETSTETSENSTNDSPPCDLGLVERLLRTHPVWFLPGIQRAGAVHLLQGKEEGNFIVRGSSQVNTMAVSVRLPPATGPYIEHYLIQSNEQILNLESSRFKFDSIPALIAHYAQCCDELPVQLVLPQALRDAKNRQQLSSLALLGQEFWRYPMANPKVNYENIDIKSPNSLTDTTSGIGMTMFSTTTANDKQINNGQQHQQKQHLKMFSPTSPMGLVGGIFNSQAGTPSDTNSSLSSFTTSTGGGQNHQLMSPESIDSIVLTMSPVDTPLGRQPIGGPISFSNKLSTFKSIQSQFIAARPLGIEKSLNNNDQQQIIRNQRPTPPNTLNLGPLRMPPAPPVRWSKPLTPNSPVGPPPPTPSTPLLLNNPGDMDQSTSNNFTVTTTVTFSVDNKNSQQFVEVTSPTTTTTNSIATTPTTTTTFQTFSKRLSPEGECKQTVDTLSSQGSSKRWQKSQSSSKDSNNSQKKMISPHYSDTPSSGGGGSRQRRIKARKESKHYQESDILESPQVYCRSALGDKISDYEDLWTQDSVTTKPIERGGCLLSSFRPDGAQGKRPDLLPETPNITSLNCNLLSPANSTGSSNNSNHPLNSKLNNEILETKNLASNSIKSITDSTANNLTNEAQLQARNRLGLVLNNSASDDPTKPSEIETPTTTPVQSRNKQGSPFYAEPADALRQAGINANILRRSQRGNLLPVNHRHSEPPKCGSVIKNSICPTLIPSEIEKIAGSLDHLKNIPSKIARNRLDPWQVDSSWEFMGKNDYDDDEYGDYDTEEQWNNRTVTTTKLLQSSTSQMTTTEDKENNKEKPLTVHQIIAKRLPDLNLPELVRCSTPPQSLVGIPKINNRIDFLGQENHLLNETHRGGYRISSYDNVERTTSYTTSFLNGIDSAHSDDGTVFSEPWDSSQWDSFLPHDGDTSESIHLSKCRPAICNSEDDTLMEDNTIKDNQSTLKPNRTEKRHGEKLATILRSRSIRDREVLCHPRNKPLILGGPGDTVRSYTLQLAKDQTSTFARNIENFISCTKDSREAAPQVVMRNMRQFMNGMKNYLVKHGEADFHSEVEKARSRLKSDEFLNLDSLLETVMHQLVVLPLREHLYGMFVDYYTRSSDIQLLAENVKYACARNPTEFGIRSTVNPPSSIALQQISILLLRLQEAELPLEKLDLFLCIISAIFDSTGCSRGQQLGADDFLPILVYVVAKCGFVGAEIEAEFMWGLLQPALLNGEAGYYLTALCSAVHVLKCFMASDNDGNGSLDWRSSSMPACSSVLRVIIPDEFNGSLQTRTLPVRPHTTTREVCRIIAHKARITNPQDYGLFKLVDGEETILTDIECPQDARLAARGKHCMLAYKRIDAKIAWPTATSS